jgi:hypothetical protein
VPVQKKVPHGTLIAVSVSEHVELLRDKGYLSVGETNGVLLDTEKVISPTSNKKEL